MEKVSWKQNICWFHEIFAEKRLNLPTAQQLNHTSPKTFVWTDRTVQEVKRRLWQDSNDAQSKVLFILNFGQADEKRKYGREL